MKKDKKDFWVNYKEVKEKVSLKMVLERYHVLDTMKPSGNNYTCCCPIHKGTNSRQFSANFERNIWQCFGDCQAGGNVLDFVAQIENVNIRKAALMLRDWYLLGNISPVEPGTATNEPNSHKKTTTNKPLMKVSCIILHFYDLHNCKLCQ